MNTEGQTNEQAVARTEWLSRHTGAPIVTTLGGIVAQSLDWGDRLSFAFNLANQNMATLLGFVFDWSWLAILVGAVWWYLAAKSGRREPNYFLTLGLVGVFGFLVGAAVTARYANPPVLMPLLEFDLGARPPFCTAMLQTEKLRDYMTDFDVIVVCGPVDPSKDPSRDERVVFSTPRNITLPSIVIRSEFSVEKATAMRAHPAMWFRAVVVRKNMDHSSYKTLEELSQKGGIIVGSDAGTDARGF